MSRRQILTGGSSGGVAPPFTPTIALSSGGAGPFRVGASWTPKLTTSPLQTAGGVTVFQLADNLSNTSSPTGAGPYDAPIGGGTYTITTPSTVSIHAHITQSGQTANTANINGVFGNDVWVGVGTAGATGLNGTTGALTGATGTLTGTLSTTGILNFSPAPTNQKVYYAVDQFYGTRSFKDASNFPFSMNAPASISVTNAAGQARNYYLYESVQLLDSVANPITVT